MKKKNDLKLQVNEAILACQDKQADNVTILELEKDSGAFTDYFVMCSGTNPRQIQAIADAVDERLEALGLRVTHAEGYKQAEWVLLDYVDFVVHIFSEKARQFYDLERLWKSAKRLEPAELMAKAKLRRATTTPKAASPTAPKKARKKKSLTCVRRESSPVEFFLPPGGRRKVEGKIGNAGQRRHGSAGGLRASASWHAGPRSSQRHRRTRHQLGRARLSQRLGHSRRSKFGTPRDSRRARPKKEARQTSPPSKPTRTSYPLPHAPSISRPAALE
jgi:ribosome-associated protein